MKRKKQQYILSKNLHRSHVFETIYLFVYIIDPENRLNWNSWLPIHYRSNSFSCVHIPSTNQVVVLGEQRIKKITKTNRVMISLKTAAGFPLRDSFNSLLLSSLSPSSSSTFNVISSVFQSSIDKYFLPTNFISFFPSFYYANFEWRYGKFSTHRKLWTDSIHGLQNKCLHVCVCVSDSQTFLAFSFIRFWCMHSISSVCIASHPEKL